MLQLSIDLCRGQDKDLNQGYACILSRVKHSWPRSGSVLLFLASADSDGDIPLRMPPTLLPMIQTIIMMAILQQSLYVQLCS